MKASSVSVILSVIFILLPAAEICSSCSDAVSLAGSVHQSTTMAYTVAQKKMDHHAVCGHNLRKLLRHDTVYLTRSKKLTDS